MRLDKTLEHYLSLASPALREKIEYSINLIRKGEALALTYDKENGYWLGMSFGKDSQALYHITELAGVKFKAFFSPTSVDPPEVIKFGKTYYPEVEFMKLRTSIYQEFIERKCLPSMKIRWCCDVFKERGGENHVTLVGVRNEESVKRAKRKEIEVTGHKFSGDFEGFDQWRDEKIAKRKKTLKRKMGKRQFDEWSKHNESTITCIRGKDKIVISPIIHWSSKDVWEFLNNVVQVPHCELYDQGRTRIGCICCPMSSKKHILEDIKRWPYVKEKWIQAIMEIRRQSIMSALNTPPLRDRLRQLPLMRLNVLTQTYRARRVDKWGERYLSVNDLFKIGGGN